MTAPSDPRLVHRRQLAALPGVRGQRLGATDVRGGPKVGERWCPEVAYRTDTRTLEANAKCRETSQVAIGVRVIWSIRRIRPSGPSTANM